MGIKIKLKHFLDDNPFVNASRRFKIKSLNGISLYELISILIRGISKGIFGMRVGAVSWAFFFSLFPFLLFLFSILPYAPLYSEIEKLLFSEFIPRLLPERITDEVINYVSETARTKDKIPGG